MATRRRATKGRRPEVDPSVWRWLCDENPDERDEDGKFSWEIFQLDGQWINHQGDDRDQLKKLWRDVEGDVLAYWIPLHPGTRPRMWWRYSAPRIPVGQWPGCYFDGKLPEPRALLGGAGCPIFERFNYTPAFTLGLPDRWEGFDPENAPMFEAEAAYLRRHKLLTAAESKRLRASDYAPIATNFSESCSEERK